jgi:hypothetical protein
MAVGYGRLSDRLIVYRREDRKYVGELKDDIGAIRKVLTLSFRKP